MENIRVGEKTYPTGEVFDEAVAFGDALTLGTVGIFKSELMTVVVLVSKLLDKKKVLTKQ